MWIERKQEKRCVRVVEVSFEHAAFMLTENANAHAMLKRGREGEK